MASVVWDIANMERHLPDGDNPPAGQIYTVYWTASLEESGESASAYGSIGLGAPDPDNYIPFDQLTKDDVINWVFEAMGPDQVVTIQESLYSQIQEKLNPTHSTGVPW